ncbi:hypothetical protein [Actinomadura atramentaria]|uniref:hypothetical protein n=1 Tax=Actinomadura atramentaria TaxID=1990 RepID=UPI0012F7D213|nr:hypothetical protein [Actinomadura atramentaria]
MSETEMAKRSIGAELPQSVQDRLREMIDDLSDITVVILPTEVRNGKVYYLPSDTEARKLAKKAGLNARYLYDGEDRSYLHEYSADWVANICIAIVGGVSTELVAGLGKYILARARSAVRKGHYDGDESEVPLKVTIQQAQKSQDGDIAYSNLSFEGEAQAVADSIQEVLKKIQGRAPERELEAGSDE